MHPYPPLNVTVTTPRVELRGATDDLLAELVPLVRAGQADADPPPFDDPMPLYERDPDTRVQKWLQAIWRGRGRVASDFWRLNLVVLIDGHTVGMQDVIGTDFYTYGAVTTFSWLAADHRGRGFGREMRRQRFTCPSTGSAPPKPPVTPSWTTQGPTASPRRSVINGTERTGPPGVASPR